MTLGKKFATRGGGALVLAVLAAVVLGADEKPAAPADEKPAAPPTGSLVIVDARGKEQTIKGWKFLQGTRRLSWLAPAPKEPDARPDTEKPKDGGDRPRPAARPQPRGPEAL